MALGGIADLALGLAAGKTAATDTGGAFVIKELSGQKREIRLAGRGLPYQPFELTTSQRISTTWLPGYAQATATILGAKEEPTTIHGYWKDKYVGVAPGSDGPGDLLGQAASALQSVSSSLTGGFGPKGGEGGNAIELDGAAVKSVLDAADKVDDVCRQGQLLEVSWGTMVRRGHLTQFRKTWHNTKDLEWDMTFEWISRGEATSGAKHGLDVTVSDTKSLLNGALDNIVAILAELPAISSALHDLVTSQLQKIVDLVQKVSDAVGALADIASLPSDTARRTVGALQSIVGTAQDTVERIDAKPAPAWHADAQPATRVAGNVTFLEATATGKETGAGGVERLTFAQRVQTIDFISRFRQAMRALRALAADRASKVAKQVHSDVIAVFVAQAGDDLRDAAFQFYGDANEWKKLLLFNGLSSPELEPGQVVLIPRADQGSGER